MRTTLTLDPDVAQTLKARMAGRNATLKEVINEALRKGLSVEPQTPKKPFRVTSYSLGFRPGIDTDKLGQLADELETQAFATKAARSHKRR
ncbi:MAG: DUF2191 domain-containing protein [Acidobacteriia bacterium]|nr:DUF2191 domain-containing protein [Terriglobia bacterium]